VNLHTQAYSVTEQQISELVDRFYDRVRADALLGPIFDRAIGNSWALHLAKMKAFWSSVMLASRAYKGNPMMTHLALPRLGREHFERWLELWRETVPEVCSEPAASVFVEKAEMIGDRLLSSIVQYWDVVHAAGSEADACSSSVNVPTR
jgi:hemoglobin